MRAIVFKGSRALAVEEVPDPVPGSGDVLIDVASTGICGSDLHGYLGETGRRTPGMIMGHETVGTVAERGSDVPDGVAVTGTEVVVNPVVSCGNCERCVAGKDNLCTDRRIMGVTPDFGGAFAERVVVSHRNVVPFQGDVPTRWGALVEPLAVGFHAVNQGGSVSESGVVVIGGGMIGLACALAARRLGASAIVVSEPWDHRRAVGERLGATAVDPGRVDLAAFVRDTLGAPASLVIDAVGSPVSVESALDVSDADGTVVVVGMNKPEVAFKTYDLVVDERRLVGSFCYTAEEFHQTADWVAAGPAGIDLLIEGHVGFDTVVDRFDALATGQDAAVKAVFEPAR